MQATKAEASGCRDVNLTCQLQWLIWWEGMGGTTGWQHSLVNAAATHPHMLLTNRDLHKFQIDAQAPYTWTDDD